MGGFLLYKNVLKCTAMKKIIIIIATVLVFIGAYFLFDRRDSREVNPISINSSSSPVIIGGNSDYTIEQLPDAASIGIPDLNRKVVFNDKNIDENTRKLINQNILSIQTSLKKDNTQLDKWLELGRYYKMAGDFTGASISWTYVSKVAPSDYVSLGNLGDLYSYYIKDKNKGEEYYKSAISNAPTQSYLYVQLASVYKDVFKDTIKAREIIDLGLTRIPNDKALLSAKSSI